MLKRHTRWWNNWWKVTCIRVPVLIFHQASLFFRRVRVEMQVNYSRDVLIKAEVIVTLYPCQSPKVWSKEAC